MNDKDNNDTAAMSGVDSSDMLDKQSPNILTTEQEVWLRAWCAYASASNSTSVRSAKEWADRCLEGFRDQFSI